MNTRSIIKTSDLIDDLAYRCGTSCLSDLRYPDFRASLLNCLLSGDLPDYPVEKWSIAVEYITGHSCKLSTKEEIICVLISHLEKQI